MHSPRHSVATTTDAPTIRLVSAVPSASGSSTIFGIHQLPIEDPLPIPVSTSSLAPRQDTAPRKRLVPKKSKLNVLKERGKDLSDAVRRVGNDSTLTRGSELCVDPPLEDDSVGDIVVVKKKKSRLGLDGMKWGALGEVTNVPAVSATTNKENHTTGTLKMKGDESQKWWSIGRGRKDSKTKDKENVDKSKTRAISPESKGTIRETDSCSQTPQHFGHSQSTEPTRGRFNSLDSGIILNTPLNKGPAATMRVRHPSIAEAVSRRSVTPPSAYRGIGIVAAEAQVQVQVQAQAPPATTTTTTTQHQGGSIALRAMRSVRSLARIGSWASMKIGEDGAGRKASLRMKVGKDKKETIKEKEKKGDEKEERVIELKEKEPEPETKEGKKKKKEKKKDVVEGEEGEKKKKKKKKKGKKEADGEDKEKEKEKERERETTKEEKPGFDSSFEAGSPTPKPKEKEKKTLGKKGSILGLGLPSSMTMTMRLPGVRTGSNASSILVPPATIGASAAGRLSTDPVYILNQARENRSASGLSHRSSLRPLSIGSSGCASRMSSGASSCASGGTNASVKWDEEGLQTGREQRRKERREREEKEREEKGKEKEKEKEKKGKKKKGEKEKEKKEKEKKASKSEAVKRTPLSDVFPEGYAAQPEMVAEEGRPVLKKKGSVVCEPVEESKDERLSTPVKRHRIRPMSEQLMMKDRPLCCEGDDAVLSILDAATNDLAQLISHLDLEATPGTPDMTPLKPYGSAHERKNNPGRGYDDSPTKNRSLDLSASVSSLRAYKSKSAGAPPPLPPLPIPSVVGQQITPWAELMKEFSGVPSPRKGVPPSPAETEDGENEARPSRRRTLSPPPDPEPAPVFRPLRPAQSSKFSTLRMKASTLFGGSLLPSPNGSDGSGSGTVRGKSVVGASPVFKRQPVVVVEEKDRTIPITPEARRLLGMGGTLGAEDGGEAELDVEDPDSDVPDELRVILSSSRMGMGVEEEDEDDTLSFVVPRKEREKEKEERGDGPPVLEMLVFDDDEGEGGEGDTKKSFDFTGEIRMLNERETSHEDRESFLRQLENAFRTPAKIDFRGIAGTLVAVDVPPVGEVAGMGKMVGKEVDVDVGESEQQSLLHLNMTAVDEGEEEEGTCGVFSAAAKERFLASLESLGFEDVEMADTEVESPPKNFGLSASRPSCGQLNTAFKFGGKPAVEPVPVPVEERKPLTLSDIIPPPSHVRSVSDGSILIDDESLLKTIFAKASDIPQVRVHVTSDAQPQQPNPLYRHSRHSSGHSFVGFDSFEEVRRAFEASDSSRFYPPPPPLPYAVRSTTGLDPVPGPVNNYRESAFSIASVSSYGRAFDNGLMDPFDYGGVVVAAGRPCSEAMSNISILSSHVDDTFSFIHRQPRKRVESDASSFYFKAPQGNGNGNGNGKRDSVASQGPPISLYSRRTSWVRHSRGNSLDSVSSDFSVVRLGRPGLGDKMFEEPGMPLSAIAASPTTTSAVSSGGVDDSREEFEFDSLVDEDCRLLPREDSLFEKMEKSVGGEDASVFGGEDGDNEARYGTIRPIPRYRPLSVLTFDRPRSPAKEDDTMVTMFGGGHVRRQSMQSVVESSPCARVEKKKKQPEILGAGRSLEEYLEAPGKSKIMEKPSLPSPASESDADFGKRMTKTQSGLYERHSLEESCLVGSGEDSSSSFDVVPVFSRPSRPNRSRSSTCTSSSGTNTPPLSISDGFSSVDEGSISTIDLSHLNFALGSSVNSTSSNVERHRRARARGHGHRKRISYARSTRSSVYETIEEEIADVLSPPPPSDKDGHVISPPIFVVDPETVSLDSLGGPPAWDEENGFVALRKYYALRDEAQTTITESKRQWSDTPISLFALQSFQPPRSPTGMQALLEHSVQNYGPLPSELRPRRVRTQSRPSPYPQRTAKKSPRSVEKVKMKVQPSFVKQTVPTVNNALSVLKQISINRNISIDPPAKSPSSPVKESKQEKVFGLTRDARPRVGLTAKKSIFGLSKRGNGKPSTDLKENVAQGTMVPDDSLRITKPRPRNRQALATAARPIRI